MATGGAQPGSCDEALRLVCSALGVPRGTRDVACRATCCALCFEVLMTRRAMVDFSRSPTACGIRPRTEPFGDAFRFELKWPNDIIVNGKKLGGILAEAKSTASGRLGAIIVGIGINVNKSAEELATIARPVWPAASLLSELPEQEPTCTSPFRVPAIRDCLAVTFLRDLQLFCGEGFQAFRGSVDRLQILKHKPIAFNTDDRKEGEIDKAQVLRGTFAGIGNEGELVLRLPCGQEKTMISGEVIPLPEGEDP